MTTFEPAEPKDSLPPVPDRSAQAPAAVRPHDPSALSSAIGRLPIHAIRRSAAVALDGEWAFQLLGGDEAPLTESWTSVEVPELWTMRLAEDPAHYTNVPMPFPDAPPIVPSRNPVGVYRRTVQLRPRAGWRTILHVGAAAGYLRVAVNGVAIGSSTDSHLEAEFDVSGAIVDGENTIELRVAKWSAHTYLEDQDHWWQSGIPRSVFLYEVPAARIADVVTVADYDHVTELASLRVEVHTEGVVDQGDADGWTVEVEALGEARTAPVPPRLPAQTIPAPVRTRDSRPAPRLPADFMDLLSIRAAGASVPARLAAVAERFAQTASHADLAGVGRDERRDLEVAPWTAETPHLEDVTARLRDPSGAVVDEVSLRVGFRRVEIVGRDLLINGRRVLIQGVNRHDIDPRTGRVMSRERMRDELMLLKRFNVNAIRTAHYPNDPYLLDLCDELGFYVIDEADIEGHAFAGTLADDPRYLPAFHERFSRMVVRDRNHPSVIAWSLGNETGYGSAHDSLAAWSRRFDPTRPVHYEGAVSADWHGGHAATDIVCPMYPSFDALVAYSADTRADRPVILCEYAYSQGNGTGGLADYAELFEALPGLQGGFIWQFLDHALDPEGDGRGRYGGDFGDTPNDGHVLLNGIAFSDLTPKPAMWEARAVFAPVRIASDLEEARRGILRIRNRRTFTDLTALRFAVRVETTTGAGPETELPRADAAPGETQDLPLPDAIVAALDDRDALALTLVVRTADAARWADAGTELAVVQLQKDQAGAEIPAAERPARVDRSGRLSHRLLVSPPRLSLWRALTDNDESFALDNRFVRSGFFLLEPADVDVVEDSVSTIVTTTYRGAFGDEVVHRCRVSEVGEADWVFAEDVALPETTTDGVRVGVEFELAEGFDTSSWVGLGPEENYPDRRSGALLSSWERPIDEWAVPYLRPQHNGTRGEVTKLELAGSAGQAVVTADRGLHATVARHTVEELERADHWWELASSRRTIVAVDVAHRGVGMARLGPDTRPEHRLDRTTYAWRWRLRLQAR